MTNKEAARTWVLIEFVMIEIILSATLYLFSAFNPTIGYMGIFITLSVLNMIVFISGYFSLLCMLRKLNINLKNRIQTINQ